MEILMAQAVNLYLIPQSVYRVRPDYQTGSLAR